ncbi:MAG: choice-of-anchor Q domain-containing protein, partial [Thermoguttaceae bacterium]
MKFSLLESLSAAVSKRSNKGFTARKNNRRPRRQAQGQRGFRLGLEQLEERCLLTPLTVNSPLDSSDSLSTPGTLRYEINQANVDGAHGIADVIYFSSDLNGSSILLQQGHLELTSGASLDIWGYNQITLIGDNSNIFQVDSGASLALHELTLTGGTVTYTDGGALNYGGAINNAGSLSLNFCTITGNKAVDPTGYNPGQGGAVYNTGTLVTPYPCTFTDNSAAVGGAIANEFNGTATLTSSTFSGNAAVDGGAVYNGVSIYTYDTESVTLSGCTLSGNSAQYGGGLFNTSRALATLDTCTLSGNTATGTADGLGQGGALYNGGTMTLSASTVSANSGYQGGGAWSNGSLTLADSIVAGNTLTDAGGADPDLSGSVVAASSYNLIGDGTGESGITNGTGGNKIGTSGDSINPLLAPLAANGGSTETMAPLAGSPAIEAGGPITTLTSAIGATDTAISVADAAAIASTALVCEIQIDGEQMLLTNVDLTHNILTVSRELPPIGVAHSFGAGVYFAYDQRGVAMPLPGVPDIGAVQLRPASQLAFTTQPTSAAAGASIAPAVQVSVEDASGNLVATDNSSVTLALTGGGTLGGTYIEPAAGGVATFSDLSISTPGNGYTLTATDGSLVGATSTSFNITPRLTSLVVNSPLDSVSTSQGILTLREAVNQADADGALGYADTISFASSLNGASIFLALGHLELTPGAAVSIWGYSQITLEGDGTNIFQVDSGASLFINGLTLAGGTAANGNGGAINNAGTLTVQACTFDGNTATGSAAPTPSLGPMGGAIYNTGTLVTSYPNIFTKNSAACGGAIANGLGGVASLENDTYSGNSASTWGGAIFNWASPMTVYGCTLSGNKASLGGGLFNYGGTLTVNTATLAGNTATGPLSGSGVGQGAGGALYNAGAMTLTASTVSGNAGYYGGGIAGGDLGFGDPLTMVDSIVAGNTWYVPGDTPANPAAPYYPDVCSVKFAAGSFYDLIGDGTGESGVGNGNSQVGTASNPINPLLAPLGNYGGPGQTMPPLSGSPALAMGGYVTSLTAGIDNQVAVLPVADAAVFESTTLPYPLSFQIDGEQMSLESVDLVHNTITVAPRGQALYYTAPASHKAGAGLYITYANPRGGPPSPIAPSMGAVQPAAGQLVVSDGGTDATNPPPGLLRWAVNQANADSAIGLSDSIIFAPAAMDATGVMLAKGPLELKAGSGTTTIDGGGQIQVYQVVGGSSGSVFVVDSGATAVLTGLTITGGQAGMGGGINNSGTLTLSNSTIANNSAVNTNTSKGASSDGGGICNMGTATLTDVTVANNSVQGGASGIAYGGGIFNTGKLTATDCTFSGNTASIKGGSPTSGEGGAIYNAGAQGASVSLVATTVSANSAMSGGGIASFNTLTLTDSIVAGNTLSSKGGTGQDILGSAAASSAYNLIGIGPVTGISTANHNQVGKGKAINAYLCPLGNYGGNLQTMALLPGSPAVGKGGGIAGITTDERGLPVTSPPCIGACQTVKITSFQVLFLGTAAPAKHGGIVNGNPVTSAIADNAFNVEVVAQSTSGPVQGGVAVNVNYTVQGSSGVHRVDFSSSDTNINSANSSVTLDSNGTWSGGMSLHIPGTDTLTVASGIINQGYSINVSKASPQKFTVDAPKNGDVEKAGQAFNATVNAWDAGGQKPLGYGGTVKLSVVGGPAGNGINCTMKDGAWTGPVTLTKAAKGVTLTATAGSYPCTPSGAFSVQPGPTENVTMSVPDSDSLTAGQEFTVTFTLTDHWGNPSSNTSTALITCTPGQTMWTGKSTNGNGTQTENLTLDKSGTFTLKASMKTATGTATAKCNIGIRAAVIDHFLVEFASTTVLVGRPTSVEVTPKDQYGNIAGCTGNATLSTDDGSDVVSDYSGEGFKTAFVPMNGRKCSANVLLEGVGHRTVTATESVTIGSATVTITGSTPTSINVT